MKKEIKKTMLQAEEFLNSEIKKDYQYLFSEFAAEWESILSPFYLFKIWEKVSEKRAASVGVKYDKFSDGRIGK